MREESVGRVFYPLALFDQTHASQLKIRSQVSTTLRRCRLVEKPTYKWESTRCQQRDKSKPEFVIQITKEKI